MDKKAAKKPIEIVTPTGMPDSGICGPDGCMINWDKEGSKHKKEGE